ncbi:uncharacterized protein PITG_09663 [Phytophthora infestans T30-4]|uniref:Uncharacterized protein n=2 Tax=Phytophthora infestans TaxID=4787 RepID=D0NCI4_PHYIT|nr:uncharacterized protein PITG_09663 [Phytophthora infestans T30-4]EEY55698.1 hypothetical protein PITG_09663 [Phytophthora infestans T30-4]KAF4036136.1 hypothetical protein GN244_ATG11777 [Phytophthora infestans]|eukprot:XP_002903274.1 hypothetical protein PITG_09663 [Phytophthora infestans T30-4]
MSRVDKYSTVSPGIQRHGRFLQTANINDRDRADFALRVDNRWEGGTPRQLHAEGELRPLREGRIATCLHYERLDSLLSRQKLSAVGKEFGASVIPWD